MEKYQFETLMLAITGLNAKIDTQIEGLSAKIDTQIESLSAKMDAGFKKLSQEITVIREQTATHHVTVIDHEHRIRKLEGPSS